MGQALKKRISVFALVFFCLTISLGYIAQAASESVLDVKLIRQKFYPPERSVKIDDNGRETGLVYSDVGEFDCVPASVAMILAYLKETKAGSIPDSFSIDYKTAVRRWFRQRQPVPSVGFRIDIAVDLVPKMTEGKVKVTLAFTNGTDWQDMLRKQMAAGYPVLVQIVDWRLLKNERLYRDLQAHAIVVTGLRGNEVHYQDPWVSEPDGKATVMSVDDFGRAWGNQQSWAALTFAVEEPKPAVQSLLPAIKRAFEIEKNPVPKYLERNEIGNVGERFQAEFLDWFKSWINELALFIDQIFSALLGPQKSAKSVVVHQKPPDVAVPRELPVLRLAGPRFQFPAAGHRFFSDEDLVFEVYPLPAAQGYQWRIVQDGRSVIEYENTGPGDLAGTRYVIKAYSADHRKIKPASLQVKVRALNAQGRWTEESSLTVQLFRRAQSLPRETPSEVPQPPSTNVRRGETVQILPIMNRPVCGESTPGETGFSINGQITLGTLYGGPGVAGVFLTAGKYSAYTDAQGYFTIRGVPGGSYTLVGSKEGYVSFESTMFQLNCNLTKMNYLLRPRR